MSTLSAAIPVAAAAAVPAALWPARVTADADTPWVPPGPGRAFKPIRFFSGDRGYVALMRVDPGTAIPRHRHTGTVHALNLAGWRELATGERIGPGDYVHEAPGNTDSWACAGDEAVIVLIVVTGAVEYLGPDDQVLQRYSADSQLAAYLGFCVEHGLAPRDLTD